MDFDFHNDNRNVFPAAYIKNYRRGSFLRGWGGEQGGINTWSHLGAYCRDKLGAMSKSEMRRVYLGLLIAYINSLRCSHWTQEQRDEAIKEAQRDLDDEQ